MDEIIEANRMDPSSFYLARLLDSLVIRLHITDLKKNFYNQKIPLYAVAFIVNKKSFVKQIKTINDEKYDLQIKYLIAYEITSEI